MRLLLLQRLLQRPKMDLFGGSIDHAAEQFKTVATPLLNDVENRLAKIAEDFLDRVDGADISINITVRLPKKAEPA